MQIMKDTTSTSTTLPITVTQLQTAVVMVLVDNPVDIAFAGKGDGVIPTAN